MEYEHNIVTEYKAAREVVRNGTPSTAIRKHAELMMRELGGRAVTYKIPCIVCGTEYDFTITVKAAADLMDKPRGVCGKHGKDDIEVTLIVT